MGSYVIGKRLRIQLLTPLWNDKLSHGGNSKDLWNKYLHWLHGHWFGKKFPWILYDGFI